MFLNGGILKKTSGGALPVQLPAIVLANQGTFSPIYSGIRFDNDGKIYRQSSTGIWQYAADWLLDGVVGDYYLSTTIVTGTLTTDDGRGPTVMSTANIDYSIANLVDWFNRTAQLTCEISDDSSGSPILVSRTYNLSAYREGTGTPP